MMQTHGEHSSAMLEGGAPPRRPRSFSIDAPDGFSLSHAVCSYGFFMLAPSRWVPSAGDEPGPSSPSPPSPATSSRQAGRGSGGGALERPLHAADGSLVHVRVTQPTPARVVVEGSRALTDADEDELRRQVVRMLRLTPRDSVAVAAFHALHPGAARARFGRLFRSPSVFEDVVKSILLCNCGWPRTLSMSQRLCTEAGAGGFPTARQVVALGQQALRQRCGLGYRAATVHKLAMQVCSGEVDLEQLLERIGGQGESTQGGGESTQGGGETKQGGGGGGGGGEDVQQPGNEEGRGGTVLISGSSSETQGDSGLRFGATGSGGGSITEPRSSRNTGSVGCRQTGSSRRSSGSAQQQQQAKVEKTQEEGKEGQGEENAAAAVVVEEEHLLLSSVLRLPGCGPYVAANLLQLLGVYSRIPADSETVRHLAQRRGLLGVTSANVAQRAQQAYGQYAPFQFLAYWHELWEDYEAALGESFHTASPTMYSLLTGHTMRKRRAALPAPHTPPPAEGSTSSRAMRKCRRKPQA